MKTAGVARLQRTARRRQTHLTHGCHVDVDHVCDELKHKSAQSDKHLHCAFIHAQMGGGGAKKTKKNTHIVQVWDMEVVLGIRIGHAHIVD